MNITQEVRVSAPSDGLRASAIAARLTEMGGHLTGWRRAADGDPARACFRFDSAEARRRFVAQALTVPGVSLEEPIESERTQQNDPQSEIQ